MNNIQNIDANTLNKWLQNGEAVLIDVREPSECVVEKIIDSINIPLANIHLENISDLQKQNKKIVITCRAGVRSMMACKKIASEDQSIKLWNLEGGITAWKECGLPVI